MNLYTIHAFDTTDEAAPTRSYVVTAESEDEAMTLLARSGHKDRHVRFEIATGRLETSAPGPQVWGWVGGARMLQAG